jgi:hypothetical protein
MAFVQQLLMGLQGTRTTINQLRRNPLTLIFLQKNNRKRNVLTKYTFVLRWTRQNYMYASVFTGNKTED